METSNNPSHSSTRIKISSNRNSYCISSNQISKDFVNDGISSSSNSGSSTTVEPANFALEIPNPPIAPILLSIQNSSKTVMDKEDSIVNVAPDRSQYEQCPTMVLIQLRDIILTRKKIESEWKSNTERMKSYLVELDSWKESILKQIEDHKAKSVDYLLELQKENQQQKEAIKRLELELKTINDELSQKKSLLDSKEERIKRLVDHVQSSFSISSPMLTSPISRSTSEIQRVGNFSSEESSAKMPTKVASFSIETSPVTFNSTKAAWMDMSAKEDAIVELLFEPNLYIMDALTEVRVPDELVNALLHISEARGESMRIFHFIINKEVDNTKIDTTLFRSNSIASKMMSLYSLMYGSNYLIEILKPLIQRILAEDICYEVDPNKKAPNDDLNANLERLRQTSQMFLDSVIGSTDKCPIQFRKICKILIEAVSRKFPEDALSGVRNFIFLRYICPAILSPPKTFGLPELSPQSRRTLVLISKIIQVYVHSKYSKRSRL